MDNILVQNPGLSSAKQFFSEVLNPSTVAGYYQPLTMVSLMFDYAMGGREDNLFAFRRSSLAIHTANSILIVVLLYMLFGNLWPAVAAGLLFGLHPMSVEVICWLGERKTLLATFFSLWSLIFYIGFARKGNWKFYAGCMLMYVLALMSKPISTMLPAVMLLMDFWPLGRFGRKSIIEKLPFFALAAVSAVITYISQTTVAGVDLPGKNSLGRICLMLCHNIVFYIHKTIWPIDLTVFYEPPNPLALSNPIVLVSVISAIALIVFLIISLRWTRSFFTGWLIFFVMVLPAMQIVAFSDPIVSNKFVYLPSIGFLMVLVWLFSLLTVGGKPAMVKLRRCILVILVLVAGVAETAATRRYMVYWRDTETLGRYMLELSPNVSDVHNLLGLEIASKGRYEEAISYYRSGLEIKDDSASLHNNLALVFAEQGDLDAAIVHYQRALEINEKYGGVYNNLGKAFADQGKFDEAIRYYRKAIETDKNYPGVYNNLGNTLMSLGRFDEAVGYYRKALQLKGDYAKARFNLGKTLALQGKFDEAIDCYRKALALESGDDTEGMHYYLAIALKSQGKLAEAISHYLKVLQIEPKNAEAHCNLGNILASQNKSEEAIGHYRKAIQFKADYALAHNNLGDVLSTAGKYDEALEHFRRAIAANPEMLPSMTGAAWILVSHPNPKLRNVNEAIVLAERAAEISSYQNPAVLNMLSTAYAAAGRFAEAVTTAEAALELAVVSGNKGFADHIRQKLSHYRQNNP